MCSFEIHLQNTLSLSVASSSPACTSLLVALQLRDLPLSIRVGMKVNIDVELFPSSESWKINRNVCLTIHRDGIQLDEDEIACIRCVRAVEEGDGD